ncbi:uncharacterized protein LOC111245057 [Varroa destructor]|uniref:Uncharacterized protein n=1 Tax=Varroa destructor TaxID=109461 RepID=A0A7M7JDT6_VARDE|nr:uncharacterized protein LOC111245057 [Varroa destructor]
MFSTEGESGIRKRATEAYKIVIGSRGQRRAINRKQPVDLAHPSKNTGDKSETRLRRNGSSQLASMLMTACGTLSVRRSITTKKEQQHFQHGSVFRCVSAQPRH